MSQVTKTFDLLKDESLSKPSQPQLSPVILEDPSLDKSESQAILEEIGGLEDEDAGGQVTKIIKLSVTNPLITLIVILKLCIETIVSNLNMCPNLFCKPKSFSEQWTNL